MQQAIASASGAEPQQPDPDPLVRAQTDAAAAAGVAYSVEANMAAGVAYSVEASMVGGAMHGFDNTSSMRGMQRDGPWNGQTGWWLNASGLPPPWAAENGRMCFEHLGTSTPPLFSGFSHMVGIDPRELASPYGTGAFESIAAAVMARPEIIVTVSGEAVDFVGGLAGVYTRTTIQVGGTTRTAWRLVGVGTDVEGHRHDDVHIACGDSDGGFRIGFLREWIVKKKVVSQFASDIPAGDMFLALESGDETRCWQYHNGSNWVTGTFDISVSAPKHFLSAPFAHHGGSLAMASPRPRPPISTWPLHDLAYLHMQYAGGFSVVHPTAMLLNASDVDPSNFAGAPPPHTAQHPPVRDPKYQKKRYKNWKRGSTRWTPDEDALLRKAIRQHKQPYATAALEQTCAAEILMKWSVVAKCIPGRGGKQCRDRWFNKLDPSLIWTKWTAEEDKKMIELQKEMGNKWVKMATKMPGRSENAIKNRWNNARMRKQKLIAAARDGEKSIAGAEVEPESEPGADAEATAEVEPEAARHENPMTKAAAPSAAAVVEIVDLTKYPLTGQARKKAKTGRRSSPPPEASRRKGDSFANSGGQF